MASVIDPERHAQLIALQRAVNQRFTDLDAFDGDDSERPAMREAARQAVTEKEAALYASDLIEEHGYHVASQALKQATRADD